MAQYNQAWTWKRDSESRQVMFRVQFHLWSEKGKSQYQTGKESKASLSS